MSQVLRLSAIVPATDGPPTLARCTAAIDGADNPPEEVILVEKPYRASPAEARNRGAAEATGDVLVFVDADVIVHPDAFTRLRSAFDADPALAAVFGCYDDSPEAPGLVSLFRNLLHHHVHHSSRGPATTFWTGLGAIRREAFRSVDGFDADRFPVPSIEDVELGMRLAETGARIELDPDLQGTHLKAWTIPDMVRTDFTRRGVPWLKLMLERRSASSALNLGWRHRLSTLAALAGSRRARHRPAPDRRRSRARARRPQRAVLRAAVPARRADRGRRGRRAACPAPAHGRGGAFPLPPSRSCSRIEPGRIVALNASAARLRRMAFPPETGSALGTDGVAADARAAQVGARPADGRPRPQPAASSWTCSWP